MKKDQNGFSVVEVIMAIVIVGLVGVVGWMFLQNSSKGSKTNDAAVTKDSHSDSSKSSAPKSTTTPSSRPISTDKPAPRTKTFNGGYGVNWVSFKYPADWTISSDVDVVGTGPDVVPGILIKSQKYKIVNVGQSYGVSGNYILIGAIKTWNASIAYWESEQQPADPNSTFGHFTFAGKPAVIWRGTTAQDTKKPPIPGLSDMYKGEDTWIQGDRIIYTFGASTGADVYYSDKSLKTQLKGEGNQQELYDAVKIVLDSWKWK